VKLAALLLCGCCSSAVAAGLVYVDADDGFVTGAPNIGPLSAIDSNVSIQDNLWGYRGLGVDATIFESSINANPGDEDSPELTFTLTTANGLVSGGNYDVYVAYWSSNGADWTIKGRLPTGPQTTFNRTGPLPFLPAAVAGTPASSVLWATPPAITTEADRVMLLGRIGTATAAAGQINVLIDDLPTTAFAPDITPANAVNYRSWLDGVAFIEAGTPLSLQANINRDTGQLTLANNTGASVSFTAISITSASQALDATKWKPITENYDQGGGLDTDAWEITAPAAPLPNAAPALTEIESAGAVQIGATLNSGGAPINLGNVWKDTRFSDVQVAVTIVGGAVLNLTPTYSGVAHIAGDFSNNGLLGLEDYLILTANMHSNVSTLGQADAYLKGDMNGDLAINYADFVAFRAAFPPSGAGSFAALIGQVPEPSTAWLFAAAIGLLSGVRRRVFCPARLPWASLAAGLSPESIPASHHAHIRTRPMIRTYPIFVRAALAACVLLPVAVSQAANVTLSASDTLGNSSFNSGLNWNNAAAPSADNDYFTGDFILRTPPDAGSYSFGGNSLTVNNTNGYPQGLLYKGTGTTGVITVNNLILNGGFISHANGVGDLFQLSGTLNVAGPSTINAKQGNINISSVISGAGALTISQTDAPGEVGNRFVTFQGANTYTGNVTVAGKLRVDPTGALKFNIGANGVNNSISGAGIAQYNGAFNFDLSAANATLGNSWQITNVTTQTFGDNFNIPGFFEYASGTWINGNFQFSEATGALSVVPAPDLLTLRVNTTTGVVSIANKTAAASFDLNYYEIRSATGSLDLNDWSSIDGNIPPSATSWEKAGGSTASLISETNLQGMTTLAPAGNTSLGSAYAGTLPAHQELQFYYGTTDSLGTLFRGFVEYYSGGLTGDYNGNGTLDAADYTKWRDTLGQNVPNGTGADGNGNGTIDSGDYSVWKTSFILSGGAGDLAQSASVPEPLSVWLSLGSGVGALLYRQGRRFTIEG